MDIYEIQYAMVIDPGYDVRYWDLSLLIDTATNSISKVDRAFEEMALKGVDELNAVYLPGDFEKLIPLEVFGVVEEGFNGPAAFTIVAPEKIDLKNPVIGYATPLDNRQVKQLRWILYGRTSLFDTGLRVYYSMITNKGIFSIFSPFFPPLRVKKSMEVEGSRFRVEEVWLK